MRLWLNINSTQSSRLKFYFVPCTVTLRQPYINSGRPGTHVAFKNLLQLKHTNIWTWKGDYICCKYIEQNFKRIISISSPWYQRCCCRRGRNQKRGNLFSLEFRNLQANSLVEKITVPFGPNRLGFCFGVPPSLNFALLWAARIHGFLFAGTK
jgi:hypothetical protein